MKNILLTVIFASFMSFASAQVFDTTNLITPGTLNTLAKTYLTTVTNLTIKGTIDARDFKTMRDSMPLLSVLDLSNTIIASYTGKAGTQDSNNDTYAANAIPQYAFYNNMSLIGDTTLISITLPYNITSIGDYSFYWCASLKDINIPSSVISIGKFAFYNCNGLTGSLNIPSLVASVGAYAFDWCSGLNGSLTIPSSVVSIGDQAFVSCNITAFIVDITNPSYCSINGVLFNKSKTTLIECPNEMTGTYTIPSSVDSIRDFAFFGCSQLTGSLTIPSSVVYIGVDAFNGCYGFTGSLTIPSSVTYIGYWAFSDDEGLTSIVTLNPIPLTLPYLRYDIPAEITNDVFYGDYNVTSLYVPCGSIEAYKAALQWNSFNVIANDRYVPISASSDTVKSGLSVTFTANTSCINGNPTLQWQVNGKNEGTGNYIFSYIPVNGDTITCNATIDDTIVTSNAIVMNVTGGAGINIVNPGSFSLYPNPNNGNFTIEFSNPDNQNVMITITDMTGKTVFDNSTTQNTFNFTGNKLQPGVYIVTIKGDDSLYVSKLVVK